MKTKRTKKTPLKAATASNMVITKRRTRNQLSEKADNGLVLFGIGAGSIAQLSLILRLETQQPLLLVKISGTHECKFTGKQTRNWKPLDANLQDYMAQLIKSSVKSVVSFPKCRNEESVQDLLSDVQKQLLNKLKHIRVPKKTYGEYKNVKHTLSELKGDCEKLTDQKLMLEKAIRQEKRQIEKLEEADRDIGDGEIELDVQVPNDQLNLPKLDSYT